MLPFAKILFLLLIFVNLASCSQSRSHTNNKGSCTVEEHAIIKSAYDGDYGPVRSYLENGGDPMLECQADGTTAMTYYTNSIAIAIQLSDSTELIKYYLNLDISQEVKNDYLQFFLKKRDSELVPYLIEGNAHFPKLMKCCPFCLNDFKFAVEHGYDLNWKDPKSGYSLFLSYVGCPSEEYVEANIEVLQYLIDQGADIHQVSDKGQNALDIAVNEDIIAFLKPLYE
ncbi:MAG: ankyrin repeat protein [Crocinitomix sp.]|jgi:ankyrin repeat protein